MPPKDTTATDLARLEKSVSENASGVERLAEKFLSVSSEMTDLATSVALLNQGMQLLLADRASNNKTGGPSTSTDNYLVAEARVGGLSIQEQPQLPPQSPRFPDLPSPRQSQQQRCIPSQQFQNPPYKIPKVDFPIFNGSGVRSWLQKVHRFFLVHPVPADQKVLYASLSFQGKAKAWFATNAALFE
ncbi:hypothetical protein ACHQM5_030093 [Ranunculus cassubicifolius]